MPDLAQQVGSAAIFLAGDRLCRSHVGKKASAALEVALSALICWLFPDDSHFGRTHGGGVRAIAGVACAHGLLLLKARRHTKLAKQVGRVLTREQRAVFWPELFRDVTASRREVAVHELMHLQLLAVRGQGMCLTHYGATADDLNILYQWFGPSRYVGKARLVRDSRPQVPGVGQRFLEHFLRWKRPHLKGADVTRYAKFRRTSATGMAFLVCRAGPERMISAAEIVEIRRHCPEANVQGNPLAQRQRVTRRSRPPASQRRRSQYAAKAFPGTFEGPFAGQQLQAALKTIGRARDWHDRFQHPDLGQLLQYNFRRGYAHYVQAWMASTGCIGPVNIYSRQKWKLLAMFLGTFGCEIDWALLDKHWGAPCAMIELWSKLRRFDWSVVGGADPLTFDMAQERTHFQRSHAPYALLRDSLQFPRGHVVCPDDKVRQFRWVMPYTAYFLLIAWFVSVSQTWTTSSMSTDEANSWCRAMLLALVPPLLHARMGITRRGWFLPYMYGTVKAKCFGSGPDAGKHVCNKPGHSCLRRIVSYATWKARRSWRAAGRALSFIAQSVLLTDEVPSLKQARPFMAEGLERLQPCREVHVCDRCHGPCEGLQGIVADAGQFFEAVQVPDACEAADRVLNLAELDGHSSVTVAGKKHVFFGGSIYRSMQQCLVFSLEELYWLFTAACNMRFAHTVEPYARAAYGMGYAMFMQCRLKWKAMVVVLILVIVSDKPCHVTLRLLRRQFAWKSLLLVMGARHPSTMGMAVKGMKGRMVVTVIAPVAVASVDMAFASRADRKTEAKQAEDRLMAEMQKMRAELARKTAEPSTPKRRSTRHPEVQWTPKIHAHLQSLCAFMCNGEKIHLVDASRVHGWEDIQEQLQAHSAPTLKKYLATKVPASEVPRTKPAIIAAIVALVSEAVRV
ncbi:unnamed protein product [Symbiodinium sp. CCMP2456]|nr:unnamed protein product [Symbiodinium sp. CCMP2456]